MKCLGRMRQPSGCCALSILLLLGCAYGSRGRDIDRTPVVDTGVGATILYPGQTVPMPAPEQTAPATPEASAAGGGPAAAPGQAPVTYIGGAAQDEKKSLSVHEEPLYYKYALLPFALAAAPFVAAADLLRGDEEPGPALPQPDQAAPAAPPPPAVDYETRRLQAMQRELAGRDPAPQEPDRATSGPSIADELASLQRRPPAPTPPAPTPPVAAPGPGAPPAAGPLAAADGIVDRDGDGRIDQWIFRENGQIVRNLLDDDGDGQPERTLHYDRASHRVARVEEDTNRDGSVDSWTDYHEGEIVRRRADADNDGLVDSWSYFREERITRHESDTSGDGFRDRVRHYVDGELRSEEQDLDGDGRAELTLHYDAQGQVTRRDQDTDGDGRVDTRSHYEAGRLVRRELLAPGSGE